MDEIIKRLHTEGKTNRAIAKIVDMSHSGVGYRLKKLKLVSNGKIRQTLEIIGDQGICNKCKEPKPLTEFKTQRCNAKNPYRLTYCQTCRNKQQYAAINSDTKKYLNDRYGKLKRRCKTNGTIFTLTKNKLFELWNEQNGNCFYTGVALRCKVGEGYDRNAFSIDKIVPEKGYTNTNVVLCTAKVNTCKSDLTLEELKLWMPEWYRRIQEKFAAK